MRRTNIKIIILLIIIFTFSACSNTITRHQFCKALGYSKAIWVNNNFQNYDFYCYRYLEMNKSIHVSQVFNGIDKEFYLMNLAKRECCCK